jgi:hypothetical protein
VRATQPVDPGSDGAAAVLGNRLAWNALQWILFAVWIADAAPLVFASVLFGASAATEVSQYYWPHGVFPGVFDPLDVAAYGVGIGVCCLADLRWPMPPAAG